VIAAAPNLKKRSRGYQQGPSSFELLKKIKTTGGKHLYNKRNTKKKYGNKKKRSTKKIRTTKKTRKYSKKKTNKRKPKITKRKGRK
jgi:hypothetical protein